MALVTATKTTLIDDEAEPLLDERRLNAAIFEWERECGDRLAKRRRELGWTQRQLAELVGIRHTAVSKFELSLATPRDRVRLALACALMCEVTDIWPPIDRRTAMALAKRQVA